MTDHVNYVGRVDHPILMDESDQTVMIKGFAGRLTGDVMLFNSFGRNYLDYWITDGSLLLCSNGVEPHDGDLVIKINQGKPAISSGLASPKLQKVPCVCWAMLLRLIM